MIPEPTASEHSALSTQHADDRSFYPSASELGIHLPRPTYWPAVLAAGVTLAAAGVVTNTTFSVAGLVIVALGIGGWIKELLRE